MKAILTIITKLLVHHPFLNFEYPIFEYIDHFVFSFHVFCYMP